MIIVYTPLSQREATKTYKAIKQWFVDNPKRKVCQTDLLKVRKAHLKEDFLKMCKNGVTLKD